MPKVIKPPKDSKKTQSKEIDSFPVDHYSASSMISFSVNPILFKIKHINKDFFDTATGISGVLGKAFHLAMQVYYGGSDTVIITSEEEAITLGLKTGMEYLENYNDGFINYSKTIPNKQKALDLLSFCFNSYIKEKNYNPEQLVATEDQIKERINVEWRGKELSLPIKLKGYLDKIIDVDGKLKIVDYKTCYAFSNPDKIDGAKIIQAVEYYLLAYVKYGREPYSVIFEEVKYTKNSDGTGQVRQYEIIFGENDLFFDFYFRLYEDITKALMGEMVYVPNVHTLFDNEVAIISYIHRLDEKEEVAKLMKKHKVDTITELLKKEIQNAGNMRKLMKTVEEGFVSAKNLNYDKMKNEEKIQTKLMEHGMMVHFDSVVSGNSVDLYRYSSSIGLKMSRIKAYTDDLEQVLGISGIRILAPITNSSLIGVEVPKENRTFPKLPKSTGDFNIAIGETILGAVRYFDIRMAPHILVAGSTGSGKSVWLHGLIKQLQKIPNAELYLFDPKQVELSHFENTKGVEQYESHPEAITHCLEHIVEEMEDRYSQMKKIKAKNISETNFAYKFIVIDEFADLSMRGKVGASVQLLAQKGRACGIHLILATQRASVRIISGDTKINFPVRVVFKVSKAVDSTVMLDEGGAEKLLGKGDMLFYGDNGIERLQGYVV